MSRVAHACLERNSQNNLAEQRGEGNRGGAVRTLTLAGSLELSGDFSDNKAPDGRGGVGMV